MRDRARKAQPQSQAIDLTPMLDVVFIMLIFFIVTASFIKTPGQEINKAQAEMATLIATSVLVAVNENDHIYIDKKKVEDNDVKSVITRLQTENPRGAVVIQADAESTLEAVAKVYDAAKAAGVARVVVATDKEE